MKLDQEANKIRLSESESPRSLAAAAVKKTVPVITNLSFMRLEKVFRAQNNLPTTQRAKMEETVCKNIKVSI